MVPLKPDLCEERAFKRPEVVVQSVTQTEGQGGKEEEEEGWESTRKQEPDR